MLRSILPRPRIVPLVAPRPTKRLPFLTSCCFSERQAMDLWRSRVRTDFAQERRRRAFKRATVLLLSRRRPVFIRTGSVDDECLDTMGLQSAAFRPCAPLIVRMVMVFLFYTSRGFGRSAPPPVVAVKLARSFRNPSRRSLCSKNAILPLRHYPTEQYATREAWRPSPPKNKPMLSRIYRWRILKPR